LHLDERLCLDQIGNGGDAISANIHRRHLSREQKRRLIERL
jgi:hypothetical protein